MHENEGVMIDLIVAGNLVKTLNILLILMSYTFEQFEEVDEIWVYQSNILLMLFP